MTAKKTVCTCGAKHKVAKKAAAKPKPKPKSKATTKRVKPVIV